MVHRRGPRDNAARAAAALRQITDQQDFDRLARARDAATYWLAAGAYDEAPDDVFEGLLDALEDAEEALEDYYDEEDGLGSRASRKARRARKKKRRAARKSRRKARRTKRKSRRKVRRRRRKSRRDRRKAGVSSTIQEVDPEDAATAEGEAAEGGVPAEGELPAEGGGGVMATLWPPDQPIYKRPIAIVGGLAVVGVLAVVLLGGKKSEKKEEKA
jgi:hypothetical protein